MNILVTGSEGFVGSFLVPELLKNNHSVVGIDRGDKTSTFNYLFFKIDLTEKLSLPKNKFDLVVHCAAAKGDWNILDEDFYRDNVVATKNLISYLKTCEVKRLIHFSTVAVYSRAVTSGCEETKTEPDSVYGITKLESEILIRKYAKKVGLPTIILRPSVIYGRQNFANMFNLIQQLSRSMPFQINPQGVVKSHVSANNVVDVVLKLLDHPKLFDGVKIFNLTERPYLDLESIIFIICDELKVNKPKINLPLWLVGIPFALLGFVGRILKTDTGFTTERLRKFSSSTHYTSEKLWTTLGKQKYNSEDELRDMVKWYKTL